MSKKNKAKFKKQIKAQILEEMARAETQAPAAPVAPSISPSPIQTDTPITKPAQPAIVTDTMIQNLPQIKHDLKKTAVVIGILALIIVVLALLDQKYNILLSFGDILFRVLHIQ